MNDRMAQKDYRLLIDCRGKIIAFTRYAIKLILLIHYRMRFSTHGETRCGFSDSEGHFQKTFFLGIRLHSLIPGKAPRMLMLALLWGETGAKQPCYISAVLVYLGNIHLYSQAREAERNTEEDL